MNNDSLIEFVIGLVIAIAFVLVIVVVSKHMNHEQDNIEMSQKQTISEQYDELVGEEKQPEEKQQTCSRSCNQPRTIHIKPNQRVIIQQFSDGHYSYIIRTEW